MAGMIKTSQFNIINNFVIFSHLIKLLITEVKGFPHIQQSVNCWGTLCILYSRVGSGKLNKGKDPM